MDRRTASRLVEDVPPSGEWRGHSTYRIAEAAPSFVAFHTSGRRRVREAEAHGPDDMHPKDRSDWFASELKRMQFEERSCRLAPIESVRALLDGVLGGLTRWTGTVARELERDAALTPEQTCAVVDSSDRLLGDLRVRLTGDVGAASDRHDDGRSG